MAYKELIDKAEKIKRDIEHLNKELLVANLAIDFCAILCKTYTDSYSIRLSEYFDFNLIYRQNELPAEDLQQVQDIERQYNKIKLS